MYDGPPVEVVEVREPAFREELSQVRVPEVRGGGNPCGRRAVLRVPPAVCDLVQVPVDSEVPPASGVSHEESPELHPEAHLLGGVRPPRVTFQDLLNALREVLRGRGREPKALQGE